MANLRERLREKGKLLLAHAPILTLGCTMVSALSLMTLATTMVLYTGSQTSKTEDSTSAENIFGNIESLEVNLGELKVRATGKNTTEVLTNLLKNAVELEIVPSDERYFPFTPQRVL